MFNTIFDDSQMVIFDEKGNIIKDPQENHPRGQKLEKDPDASLMFETHELAGNRVKSVWYPMLTKKQRALLFILLLAVFFILAWLVKYEVTKK